MIIGTAGHVDHGKTSLVQALTGIDTDRLPEEKRRGITLELGFAHLELPDGTVAGVVDVPGHERFVKAMAAGAGGVDLALFVVAADEGVMTQTREHLDICELLGVRRGVVALTKSDLLADLGAEWRALLEADVASLVAGSFLAEAPVVAVSARTGDGLVALRAALGRAARDLPERPMDGPAFLPLDRAFSLKGYGTVVTGTLLSGQLSTEEPVSLLPGLPGPFRIRSLQSHGQPAERLRAGQRAAVNLPGVAAVEVRRGMVLTRSGELPVSRRLDVELTLLRSSDRPLPRRSRLLLHLGTAQAEARIGLLDLDALEAGATGLAQLHLSGPVPALPGQRFILRGHRPLSGRGATVAGGRVLTLTAPKRRRGSGAALQPLLEGDVEARVDWLLRQAGDRGLTAGEVFARASAPQRAVQRALDVLGTRGTVLLVDRERRAYLAGEAFSALLARAVALLSSFHDREPLKDALPREELRQRLSGDLDAKLFARILQALSEADRVEVVPDGVRLQGRGRSLTLDEEAIRSRAVAALRAGGLGPPTLDALASALGLALARVLLLLQEPLGSGVLVKVSDALYFDASALADLRSKLFAHLAAHREISTQAFKDLVGQSRKYVIPLSEYFDREKVTLRVGDRRVARKS